MGAGTGRAGRVRRNRALWLRVVRPGSAGAGSGQFLDEGERVGVVGGDDRLGLGVALVGEGVDEGAVAGPQAAAQVVLATQVGDGADPGLESEAVGEVGEVGVAEEGAELLPEPQVVADEDVEVVAEAARAASSPRRRTAR